MTKCFLYLSVSGDDGKEKAVLPVQRADCQAYAARAGLEILCEFVDDGVTGELPMHARPQGRRLIAALLGDGVKTVLCYDGRRIGRTQPAFWSFIGMCRDNDIKILDANGVDLSNSVMVDLGMPAEMDRDATVARLASGKRKWRGERRVDGRWPYGEHPSHEYDKEREVVRRICKLHKAGVSAHGIARKLNGEGIRMRYGKEFKIQTIQNILGKRRQDGV
jgi:site-specific DNA recombinase